MPGLQRNDSALITGASTGIGAVYADWLARRGYDPILVSLDNRRLNQLGKEIATKTDGSEVTGTGSAQVNSPDPYAISLAPRHRCVATWERCA
jgi:uncharacterized protein